MCRRFGSHEYSIPTDAAGRGPCELHRLAGETRMAAADLVGLGLRWVLADRDVRQRLACTKVHLVNPKTGKALVGEKD